MSGALLGALALTTPLVSTTAVASVHKVPLMVDNGVTLQSGQHGVLVRPALGRGCRVDLLDPGDAGCDEGPEPFIGELIGVLYEILGDLTECLDSVEHAYLACVLNGQNVACCLALKELHSEACEANPHFRFDEGLFAAFCDTIVGIPALRDWIGDDFVTGSFVVDSPIGYVDAEGDAWMCRYTGDVAIVESGGPVPYAVRIDPAGVSTCRPLDLEIPAPEANP